MTEQATSAPSVEKWSIPHGTSIEVLNKILKTYYVAGADAKFVSLQDIIQRGVDRTPLVNNVSFLVSLGTLEREKPDSKECKLASLGLEYSKAASENNKEQMRKAMKSLLDSSYKELIDYVGLNKDTLSFEELFNHIKAMARVKEDEKYPPWKVNPAHRMGIFALIDMLKVAGLVEDTVNPPEKPVSRPTPKPKQPRTAPRKVSDDELPQEPARRSGLQLGTQIQAQVTVDVKDSKSVANFLKMMQILKRINDGEDLNINEEITSKEV
jgi:hypothetical protein